MTSETINQILKFRDDRDWKQFHNPKDLAISISLEEIVQKKIKINEKKYPVSKSKGKSDKYDKL